MQNPLVEPAGFFIGTALDSAFFCEFQNPFFDDICLTLWTNEASVSGKRNSMKSFSLMPSLYFLNPSELEFDQ